MIAPVLLTLATILTVTGLALLRRGLAAGRPPAPVPSTYEERVRALLAAPEWIPPEIAAARRAETGGEPRW